MHMGENGPETLAWHSWLRTALVHALYPNQTLWMRISSAIFSSMNGSPVLSHLMPSKTLCKSLYCHTNTLCYERFRDRLLQSPEQPLSALRAALQNLCGNESTYISRIPKLFSIWAIHLGQEKVFLEYEWMVKNALACSQALIIFFCQRTWEQG